MLVVVISMKSVSCSLWFGQSTFDCRQECRICLGSGAGFATRRVVKQETRALIHFLPYFSETVLMKKLLLSIALIACASPAMAEDNLLSALGLGGIEQVTTVEAQEVSGRGFVFAFGDVTTSVDSAEIDLGIGASFQELELEGLNAVEGLAGAASSTSYTFAENDGLDIYMMQGTLNVTSQVIVGGAAR
jgi:high-affinity K+ transport system ATPase subunit B